MNWANRLTVARFFLTLFFVVALSLEFPFSRTIGLVLFILAGDSIEFYTFEDRTFETLSRVFKSGNERSN